MKKRFIQVSLALVCGLILFPGIGVSAQTGKAATNDVIKEKQKQIEEAQKEKKSLKSGLSNLEAIKKKLEAEKADLKGYVSKLDNTVEEMEKNIAELIEMITTKEQEIVTVENELEDAQTEEENQKTAMISRIQMMYEQKDTYMYGILNNMDGFKDFVNRADFMENIMSYDKVQWENYQETRKLVELCKEEIQLEKEILDETKENVEEEKASLEKLIEQKKNDIIAYESDINNKEKAIQEYEAEIKAQDDEIRSLEAIIAAEKKRIQEQNGTVITYDGGVFKFPLASYKRISDDYGMRMHPTLHVEKFHNGIDFAADAGTAIYAAYDGKVVAAAYSATMGNYIMIDHGDSLYTIYMHASKLYVSNGTIVTKGQTIAAVGTTGRSTGNHLHFGVRKNGAYVSPWNYISR